jgi:hypothetical protein
MPQLKNIQRISSFTFFALALIFAFGLTSSFGSEAAAVENRGAIPDPSSELTAPEGDEVAQPALEVDLAQVGPTAAPRIEEAEGCGEILFTLPVVTAPVSGGPPHQEGYCRCSCGVTPNCTSSDDCGGAPCYRFPSCC